MTRVATVAAAVAVGLASLLPSIGVAGDVALVGLVVVLISQLPRIAAPGHHLVLPLASPMAASLASAVKVTTPQASPRFLIASRR